jgi:plastocyanin
LFVAQRVKAWGKVLRIGGAVLALLAAACGSGSSDNITVRVDYDHDEFATQFIRYFPDEIKVHPGDTVNFVQDWTGEAHTVTLGTKVDEVLAITKPLYDEWSDVPEDQVPPDVLGAYFAAECSLPLLYGCEPPPAEEPPATEEPPTEESTDSVNQTIAQPCLVEEGTVPNDGTPCPVRDLGVFDGTEAYYNSGFIGFSTEEENTFELNLSDTIAPGIYNFYCAVHGSFQSGTMEVVPPDQPIPSASEVNQQTRQELNEMVEPFRQVYEQANEGQFVFGGKQFSGNFSGLVDERVDGSLNEFVPKVIEASVGEPVTWLIFGGHSISFDVPEYFPIYEKLEDGTVRANEEVYPPAGGAPEVPEVTGPPVPGAADAEPTIIDGGTWDGSGFWSSGVLFADPYVQYTLRFSTPGTYRYACLIHPPMVGTVTVTG